MTAKRCVEFKDYGVHGEYGFFGKVVARTCIAGMTEAEALAEIAEMRAIVGEHCVAVEVEYVAGIGGGR